MVQSGSELQPLHCSSKQEKGDKRRKDQKVSPSSEWRNSSLRAVIKSPIWWLQLISHWLPTLEAGLGLGSFSYRHNATLNKTEVLLVKKGKIGSEWATESLPHVLYIISTNKQGEACWFILLTRSPTYKKNGLLALKWGGVGALSSLRAPPCDFKLTGEVPGRAAQCENSL